MEHLKSAKPSPRICDGTIYWYEGDTFTLNLQLRMFDQDGEEIIVGPADTVELNFYSDAGHRIHQFNISGREGNNIAMSFDGNVSARFPAGVYSFDAVYTAGDRRTVIKGSPIFVE